MSQQYLSIQDLAMGRNGPFIGTIVDVYSQMKPNKWGDDPTVPVKNYKITLQDQNNHGICYWDSCKKAGEARIYALGQKLYFEEATFTASSGNRTDGTPYLPTIKSNGMKKIQLMGPDNLPIEKKVFGAAPQAPQYPPQQQQQPNAYAQAPYNAPAQQTLNAYPVPNPPAFQQGQAPATQIISQPVSTGGRPTIQAPPIAQNLNVPDHIKVTQQFPLFYDAVDKALNGFFTAIKQLNPQMAEQLYGQFGAQIDMIWGKE